ncbi:uncharacterized protein LOC132733225 [Ruditapes philippinarum]|uniref:uncharacterized protein LOC132733225 n=1 Tax=Ruditapes philippinarum TaxID=129788 RepID=UPI00295BB38A|nr:uncharacterized protein LOC132733225 [Ruditapes philippinarum]
MKVTKEVNIYQQILRKNWSVLVSFVMRCLNGLYKRTTQSVASIVSFDRQSTKQDIMKFALCLLVVLPLALSVPVNVDEKRFIFGHIQLPSVHDLGQKIISLLGSDTSEAACEAACPTALNALVPGASLIGGSLCGPACHWVQSQING